jgi:hypothetical protein
LWIWFDRETWPFRSQSRYLPAAMGVSDLAHWKSTLLSADTGPDVQSEGRELVIVIMPRVMDKARLARLQTARSVLRVRWQRPASSPVLPGKSLGCSIEEFSAFLIQFLGGDKEKIQHR